MTHGEIMINNNIDINNFSSHLFWDTNRENLNFSENMGYIIKQVLEFGYDQDWKLLNKIYSLNQIKECAMNFRTLDKKAITFIACITNSKVEEFRCYSQTLSKIPHWIY